MSIDIELRQNKDTEDFEITLENGDFKLVNSFDTSITVALFGDKRADKSEVPAAHRRRGWWGNAYNDKEDFELGSKLWLLEQERAAPLILNKAITFTQNALQWMVEQGHVEKVEVTGVLTQGKVTMKIIFFRGQGVTETKFFDLWNETGESFE